jgi:hypothetical protein
MLNGMLMFVAVLFTFLFFSKLNALDVYHKLILILLFSIAVGLHGISHLGLEREYGFNPIKLISI